MFCHWVCIPKIYLNLLIWLNYALLDPGFLPKLKIRLISYNRHPQLTTLNPLFIFLTVYLCPRFTQPTDLAIRRFTKSKVLPKTEFFSVNATLNPSWLYSMPVRSVSIPETPLHSFFYKNQHTFQIDFLKKQNFLRF